MTNSPYAVPWPAAVRATFAALLLVAAAAAPTLGLAQERSPGVQDESYCGRDLGAWFYCHRDAPLTPPPDTTVPPPPAGEDRALAEFEAFKAKLDRASKLAVWDPTPANVERFFRLQQLALNQSSLFSDEYRRLVWTTPELDYSLKRPVSELASRDWTETRTADRELFLKRIAPEVGLFYVFRGNCGPCRVFTPIVHDFASRYALTVRGVSVDGSSNSAIATSFVDRGQLRSWGIVNPTTPSILLFQTSSLDPETGEVHPRRVRLSDDREVDVAPCRKPQGCLTYIGAGVMSQEDILERIYVMLATRPGEDF